MKPAPPSRSDSGSTGEAWYRRAAGAVPLVVLALLWGTVLAKREPALQAMAAAMLALVVAAPSAALLACAALIPPISSLEGTLAVAGPRKVAELLALAFLVGWLVRRVARSGPRLDRSTSRNRSSRRCVQRWRGASRGPPSCGHCNRKPATRCSVHSSIARRSSGSSALRFRSKASGSMSWRRRSFGVRPDSAEPWSRWS